MKKIVELTIVIDLEVEESLLENLKSPIELQDFIIRNSFHNNKRLIISSKMREIVSKEHIFNKSLK